MASHSWWEAISFCAPEGTRTPNLLIRSQMLYPLSYGRLPGVSAGPCAYGHQDLLDDDSSMVPRWPSKPVTRLGYRTEKGRERGARDPFAVAETPGFEPGRGYKTPTALAVRRHRPD